MNFLYPNDKGPLTRPLKLAYSPVVHELTFKNKLGAQAKAQAQPQARAKVYANAQAHAHAHALGNAMGNAKAKA